MKFNKNILILSTIAVLVSALAVVAIVKAATGGALTPPPSAVDGSNNPQGTMHTLENVYQNIQISPTWSHESTVIDSMCTDNGCGLVWNANNCTDATNCLDAKGNGSLMLGATEYCAYLNADDTDGNSLHCLGDHLVCSPVNYWHLPTEGELLKGLSKGFIENSDGGGFQYSYYYWSSTPYADFPGDAWSAYNGFGYVYSYGGSMSSQGLVRCVH